MPCSFLLYLPKNTFSKFFRVFQFSVVLIILITHISVAQIRATKKDNSSFHLFKNNLEVGVAGGYSLNRFTKEQPQTGLNTGCTVGLLANYQVYKNFNLQLEANFLQQGGQMIRFKDDTRIDLPETFETKNVKNSSYTLNSIEVPLLVNYTFKIKPSWKPTIYTGVSYAYTFNVTENYQKTGDLLPEEDIIVTANGSQNVTSSFTSNRLNFIAGANVKLPLYANLMLLLDFRYLNGLTAARENYSYIEKIGFGSDVRTNSFISRIGIILPIKK